MLCPSAFEGQHSPTVRRRRSIQPRDMQGPFHLAGLPLTKCHLTMFWQFGCGRLTARIKSCGLNEIYACGCSALCYQMLRRDDVVWVRDETFIFENPSALGEIQANSMFHVFLCPWRPAFMADISPLQARDKIYEMVTEGTRYPALHGGHGHPFLYLLTISIIISSGLKQVRIPNFTIYQSSSSSLSPCPLMALCLALKASANPPARLPPPMLLGVARPESVPLPVPRLMPLSRAGEAVGFLAAGTGLLAGGAGGVGFALAATGGAAGFACPLTTTAGVGAAWGGAAGGGGGGGGAARVCSISST